MRKLKQCWKLSSKIKINKNMLKFTKPIKYLLLLVVLGGILFYLSLTNFALLAKFTGYNLPVQKPQPAVEFLKIATGFRISVFAKDLIDPRVIVFDSNERMLISEPKAGRVIQLVDADNDGSVDSQKVLLTGLRQPHGLAFYTDPKTKLTYLYVAETQQVARYIYNIVPPHC